MRIAIINQYYLPDLSPTSQLAASLAEHRAAMGDQVTILTSSARYVSARGERVGMGESPNLRIIRVAGPRCPANGILARVWQYVWFFLSALWHVRRLPPQDVMICLTTPPFAAWLGVMHKWRHSGVKVVLWSMDCYPDILEAVSLIRTNGLLARMARFLNRLLFARLDHVVCPDEAMCQRLRRQYAPPRLPITVIPNWERQAMFPADEAVSPWSGADRLGLAERFVVLYMGNAGYGHEFDTVLSAAERLRDTPALFLFVGGGTKHAEIREAAARRGLDSVVLHDYVPEDEKRSVMAAANLALVTLSDRALGMMCPSKLHANLAMRLPTIYLGPAGSNVDEAVHAFGCGISLRHGQVDELTEFIRRTIADRRDLDELGHRARQAFDQAYCDSQTLPQFDAVIDTLVMFGKQPAGSVDRPILHKANLHRVL